MTRFFLSTLVMIASQLSAAETTTFANIEQGWNMVWSRFYLPKVQTFGDYVSSYEKGKEEAHLPRADEVKRRYPIPAAAAQARRAVRASTGRC